jgi:hypothetical protein
MEEDMEISPVHQVTSGQWDTVGELEITPVPEVMSMQALIECLPEPSPQSKITKTTLTALVNQCEKVQGSCEERLEKMQGLKSVYNIVNKPKYYELLQGYCGDIPGEMTITSSGLSILL